MFLFTLPRKTYIPALRRACETLPAGLPAAPSINRFKTEWATQWPPEAVIGACEAAGSTSWRDRVVLPAPRECPRVRRGDPISWAAGRNGNLKCSRSALSNVLQNKTGSWPTFTRVSALSASVPAAIRNRGTRGGRQEGVDARMCSRTGGSPDVVSTLRSNGKLEGESGDPTITSCCRPVLPPA
jgi:hypothetical protein